LTRNERSERLNDFLSCSPENDEGWLPPNITHDNCLFYYPYLGEPDHTFDWNLGHLNESNFGERHFGESFSVKVYIGKWAYWRMDTLANE